MNDRHDITMKKPVAVWNRALSISPKEFFGSLGKAAISGAVLDGKGVAENILDAAKNIVPQDVPAYTAWLLVYRALEQALSDLVSEYQEFFADDVDDQVQLELASELEEALNGIKVGLDARFFDKPGRSPGNRY